MSGFKRAVARVRSAMFGPTPGAIILLYHRVTRLESDPQWLSVTPEQFNQHLEILRKEFAPMSLETLDGLLAKGSMPPPRSVVVTFDDGYADNLLEAKPLLEKHDVPATVFITTGKIGSPDEFWWDELESLLLLPANVPDNLELFSRSWVMNGPTEQPSKRASSRWNVAMDFNPTPRHKAYRELAPLIKDLDENAREKVLDKIATWAGVVRKGRLTHRAMTENEIVELAKGGRIEVGAHTVTHSMLSSQSPIDQKFEIEQSKARLEEIIGCPVNLFSYPFGTERDYNSETVSLVGKAGFKCACSNFEGRIRTGADRFQLPRYLMRDWDGETFRRRLENWFLG